MPVGAENVAFTTIFDPWVRGAEKVEKATSDAPGEGDDRVKAVIADQRSQLMNARIKRVAKPYLISLCLWLLTAGVVLLMPDYQAGQVASLGPAKERQLAAVTSGPDAKSEKRWQMPHRARKARIRMYP